MNGLSLFSGIGGLDLGLERAGITTVGQVEIDPWCRRVLAKHWPDVPRHDDVRTAADWWLGQERPHVDLIFGGYPCQPFSTAGRMAGAKDDRHLWPYFADTIRLLRPRYALLENVPGHLGLGFDGVLTDLAGLGFDAEWSVVPASAMGAPQRRPRLLVLAHAQGGKRFHRSWISAIEAGRGYVHQLAHPHRCRTHVDGPGDAEPWTTEPDLGRMADGVPGRVDRLRGLGNAVVPQVAEHVGRLIVAADRERAA